MSTLTYILLASALALPLAPASSAADPTLGLTEDGSAFVYKARPGDQPGTVAAMFGVGAHEMPAFLAANGITDPTRVGVGHVYRIPNPLAARASEAEAKAATLVRDAGDLRARMDELARDLEAARAAAADAQERAAELARYQRWWPLVSIVGTLLVLVSAALGWLAFSALRKTDAVERHARTIAGELEEKRRGALAERQQAAKRVLDLEAKVRDLELHAVAPAPAVRRSPAGTG